MVLIEFKLLGWFLFVWLDEFVNESTVIGETIQYSQKLKRLNKDTSSCALILYDVIRDLATLVEMYNS